jgi:hypothetical protein
MGKRIWRKEHTHEIKSTRGIFVFDWSSVTTFTRAFAISFFVAPFAWP